MLGHDAISAHPVSTIELVLVDAIAAIAPPGSTLTALQSGGGSWKQVVAIEGYEHRLSDASSAEVAVAWAGFDATRSEEHTSELQSQSNLECRLLLAKR